MSKKILKRTEAQAAASRASGAKSHGPTSVEGKAKSSHNRISHGFRANFTPLATEDRAAYNDHLDAYLRRYTPIDKVEDDLVGLLATKWQLMRMNSIEVALFDLEITGLEDEIRRDYVNMDEWGRLALAFKKSAGENALELLRRYKSTAERAYHRAFQALEEIKKERAQDGRSDSTSPAAAPPDPPEVPESFPAVRTRQAHPSNAQSFDPKRNESEKQLDPAARAIFKIIGGTTRLARHRSQIRQRSV